MTVQKIDLAGEAPGAVRTLVRHIWGRPGARPKVYLQAALHADEMPGVIALQYLMDLLDTAEAEGRITGEISVVPLANPIGFGHWISHKPMGRQDLDSMQNFNRHYPDLAALIGDSLDGKLTASADENLTIIRKAMGTAIAKLPIKTDLDAQRQTLLGWSHDADYVLDCHCDHVAVMHLYAAPLRPSDTSLLCRCTGAKLALIQEISGGNAFDEVHTVPWAALKRRYAGRFPIPEGCFSTTLEYRGQFDVDDESGAQDGANLLAFLGAVGAVQGTNAPAFEDAPHFPLGGSGEAFAPQGGVVTWKKQPGDWLTKGEIVAHVTDPMTRLRMPVAAPNDGLLFRIELWRHCLRGQSLFNVAGKDVLRTGDLLSD